jgi:hypothetical protein
MTMMIYDMTLQHQAERRMSPAEQQRADEQLGRMAARTSELWRRATRPFRLTAEPRPGCAQVTASNARG